MPMAIAMGFTRDGSQHGPEWTRSTETACRVLATTRRRRILGAVIDDQPGRPDDPAGSEADDPLVVEDVVPDREWDDADVVRAVHTDLPALADAGFLDYDPRTGSIRFSERHEETLEASLSALIAELEALDDALADDP